MPDDEMEVTSADVDVVDLDSMTPSEVLEPDSTPDPAEPEVVELDDPQPDENPEVEGFTGDEEPTEEADAEVDDAEQRKSDAQKTYSTNAEVKRRRKLGQV